MRLTVDEVAHAFTVYPSLSGSIAESARLLHLIRFAANSHQPPESKPPPPESTSAAPESKPPPPESDQPPLANAVGPAP